MARITVEDCQQRVDNRFLLVQMAIKRVHQYREGYEPLVESRNKEAVTALREIAADLDEGADVIMVKPALAYLDVIRDASREFNAPLAAYNVSGEYAMLRSAVDNGILAESAIYESLLAIKRAGAKLIITYFALEIAKKLKEGTV